MIPKEQIIKKVDCSRQEALDFLIQCIRTPSVTGDELEMAKLVTRWIEKAGLKACWYEKEKDRPNVVARWDGSSPRQTVRAQRSHGRLPSRGWKAGSLRSMVR